MHTFNGPVCAQCKVAMMLERIEPHARRDAVQIAVYRCRQCQLVEAIPRLEILRLRGGERSASDARAPDRPRA
jgi:hypothetical protein